MYVHYNDNDTAKAFDWGRAAKDYAKYRDIYPDIFYQKITDRGLCLKGQRILDLGTGTGVLPRALYACGAEWTGVDVSPEQIEQAQILAREGGMQIDFIALPAEQVEYPEETFDVITACQCFWYFDHEVIAPKLAKILKPEGKLLILYMAWLPDEDPVAGRSEEMVLKYSPDWSGAGEKKHPIEIPKIVREYFDCIEQEEYDLMVPFTRDSWHGRMRACRGVGASLPEEELARWDREHRELLDNIAPERFEVRHYAALAVLQKKKKSNET